MSVVIETTLGDLTVDLFTEERPIACLNFLKLCKLKYYNYNLFHTVEQGFIAQTGDPTGAGDGGSSVWGVVEGKHKRFFEAEYLPKIYHSGAGLLSLVSAGKGLVGSQFFFTLGENLSSLDGVHCVIGEVVEGHDTLRKLNEAIVDDKFRPYQDIRITHTVVLDDPYPDPRGFQVPSRSPSPTAERLQNGRIAADEDIDDTDGMSLEEVQEMLAEREAKARATILEIVGDLPDADCAPPENVLFVCKLNPVTTDDDLEIIFSRFGKVKCCEVIRDKQSGDSLQYAFVEFEDQKSCETAYFKMDNVLIDDRRIHVDFSQSVARVKWRGKGRGVEGQSGRLDFNNLRSKPDNYRRGVGGGGERRGANGNKQEKARPRLNSEERRKAREERHLEQERKAKGRSRSRSRGDRRNNYRDDNKRRDYEKERGYRNNGNGDRRRNDHYEDRERQRRDRGDQRSARSRSRSAERRERRRSVDRRDNVRARDVRNDRRRSRSNDRDHKNGKREDNIRNDRNRSQQGKDSRRDGNSLDKRADREVQRSKEKRLNEKQEKKKTKRSRRSSSSDSSSSSAESEDESSTGSSSSSSSDSSSEEDRRRKKKNSKTKKKQKSVKNKKKSKKQRK